MPKSKRFVASVLAGGVACGVLGCAASPPPDTVPGCNPILGDDCLTPFPSAFFEANDPTTATGVRVAIPDAVLPMPRSAPLTGARFALHDGMSPSTPFIVYFKAGVDAMQLPTLATLDASVQPDSPVQVIDFTTGARVPVMAELDANALPGQRQALIIRPMVRLAPATRYVIALVGLHDAAGKPLAPAPFVALRDHTPLSDSLEPVALHYDEIFASLDAAGVARGQLTLAWDVITASDADLTGHLVAMRDQALGMVGALTWTITKATDTPADPHRLREVIGTFQVPSFLTVDTLTSVLNADAAGNPLLRGLGTANFVVDIPACAATATAPLPVLVFGHGLFGTAPVELATPYEKQVGDFLCMVQIGTDWIGLSNPDFPTLANHVLPDFNQLHIVTDRLQQAHVNAQVLTRLFLTRMKDDPALQLAGRPVTDGSQVYYYGISDGGIQGTTFMALSEDVTRGVVNVPGCEWSSLMYRSMDFGPLLSLLSSVLPDPLDQQVLLALMQPDFDATDPASFAPHVFGDRLPGVPAKQLLVQESINDLQVSNMATRVLVRTLGLPGLDLEQPVFGVTELPGPLPSAYTQWDVTPTPVPPTGNMPATDDNGAHEAIRRLVDLEDQLAGFLTPTGMVIQTCTGPCVCNLAAGTCVDPPGV